MNFPVRFPVSFFFFIFTANISNDFQVKKVNQAHHEIRDQKRNDHAKSNQKLKDLGLSECLFVVVGSYIVGKLHNTSL